MVDFCILNSIYKTLDIHMPMWIGFPKGLCHCKNCPLLWYWICVKYCMYSRAWSMDGKGWTLVCVVVRIALSGDLVNQHGARHLCRPGLDSAQEFQKLTIGGALRSSFDHHLMHPKNSSKQKVFNYNHLNSSWPNRRVTLKVKYLANTITFQIWFGWRYFTQPTGIENSPRSWLLRPVTYFEVR